MVDRDVFVAIGDPTRRRILELLRTGERPVGELVEALGIPQPSVSKHLRVLDEAALVRARIDGPRRHYGLDDDGLRDLDAWLAPFREIWADRLDALERHLDETHETNTPERPDAAQRGTRRTRTRRTRT